MSNSRRDFIKKTALATVGAPASGTGAKATFDEKSQEVVAGGKVFKSELIR